MKQSVLDEVVRKHGLWLRDEDGRERADLRYANLSSANLSYADLRYANLRYADLRYANLSYADLSSANLSSANYIQYSTGNNINIKSIQSGRYQIVYTNEVMAIGCEQHDIKDWWKFDDKTISKMDIGALDWWKVWKPILEKIIKVSPAEPTGF